MNWFNFLLLSLVCYRLANLIARDDIFHNFRILAGVYDYDKQGRPVTFLGRLVSCPYCLGVWIAIPLAMIYSGIQWYSVIIWLAIAGLQSFLQEFSK